MGKFSQVAFATIVVLSLPWISFAEPVGNASAVRPAATQTVPQGTRTDLRLKDQIIRNSELVTADKGALEVTFLDGSRLTMGQNSRLTVDEYVYSGPGSAGKQTIRYTKGLFRFVSGTIPKKDVRVETPTVSIGIRGTIFRSAVQEDGSGAISVDYGPNGEEYEVYVTSKSSGKTVTLHSGQKIGFDNTGVFEGIIDGQVEGCE
ncbi:MAG: FecR domain-containing protein [Micropepsaceae bacterium]